MDFLKAENVGKNKWRVLAIPFGGPLPGAAVGKGDNGIGYDTDGEFFSANTDIKPDWFDRRPLVWHHNMDRTMRDKTDPRKDAEPVIGTADDLELEESEGWWSTVWLNRQHQYFAEIDKLLSAGKVYGSSGSLPNFVRIDKATGEILQWPYIEQTLTPTPANLFSVTTAAKAVSHFDGAAIDLSPALRGILSDLDSQEADLGPDLPEAPEEPEAAADPAIQRLAMDPNREHAARLLVALVPRLDQLIKE